MTTNTNTIDIVAAATKVHNIQKKELFRFPEGTDLAASLVSGYWEHGEDTYFPEWYKGLEEEAQALCQLIIESVEADSNEIAKQADQKAIEITILIQSKYDAIMANPFGDCIGMF